MPHDDFYDYHDVACYDKEGGGVDPDSYAKIVSVVIEGKFPWFESHVSFSRIRKLKKLEEMKLCNLHDEIIVKLLRLEFPLKKLILEDDGQYPLDFKELMPLLKYRGHLDCLEVRHMTDYTSFLIQLLDTISLDRIVLNVKIKDFSRALSSHNACNLKSLEVVLPTTCMLDQFADFFTTNKSPSLEQMRFTSYPDYDEDFEICDQERMLFESLQTNSTMRMLEFCVDYQLQGKAFYDNIINALMMLVCDFSTVNALSKSNHSIHHFVYCLGDNEFCDLPKYERNRPQLFIKVTEDDYVIPRALKVAFEINANSMGTENREVQRIRRMRCKIAAICFRGEFQLEPFNSMKAVWMPHVLEVTWQGVSEETQSLNGMYRFIRNWDVATLFPDKPYKSGYHYLKACMAQMTMEYEDKVNRLNVEHGLKKDKIKHLKKAIKIERELKNTELKHLKEVNKVELGLKNGEIQHLNEIIRKLRKDNESLSGTRRKQPRKS